ncbi:MAG TPA: GNAT family N-acetyltransferase [Streptosporangiaceae bacterium]|nr:GNAT family N-acetyltransferase [Streptosporangiaceae bacterium]
MEAESRRRVLSAPRTAHYIAGWPRDTGLGVIAEAGSQPAGAAWIRFFPASQPGYGFVSFDVPELTIGVAAPWRGRGVGRALLRAIAGLAEQAGITRISLTRTPPQHPAWSAVPRCLIPLIRLRSLVHCPVPGSATAAVTGTM